MRVLLDADALLRAEGPFAPSVRTLPWRRALTVLCLSGFLYGIVMGSSGWRPLQAIYGGVKVPMLLIVSAAFGLPSFVVVNTFLGLRDDLAVTLRAVLRSQATVAIVLVSLSPVTALVYFSNDDYAFEVATNGVMFFIAAVIGQRSLSRAYRPLVEKNPRHRIGRALWLGIYVLVAIQLAWMLRPFIGAPGLETRFLRAEPWDNAYVVVVKTVTMALR